MKLDSYTPVVARVLLSLLFLFSALNKVFDWGSNAQYMAFKGMPLVPLFLLAAIVIELGGSLSLVLGYRSRYGAGALVIFTVVASLIFHNFWAIEDAQQRLFELTFFMKNISIIGGLLLIVSFGSGPLSLDTRTKTASAA
ncbi:MAG: DoxX family protein [Alphaproteobacteria bacterium]